jgi:F0F1-type ATP synthase membrane subunit b/b'
MKTASPDFNSVVESVYNLPLEYKEELKSLLEHNISDTRRQEIADNYKAAQKAQKAGKLKFSSTTQELKKML